MANVAGWRESRGSVNDTFKLFDVSYKVNSEC